MKVTVNQASIEKKVKNWMKTRAGENMIQQTIDGYVANNVEKTQAGSPIVTEEKLHELVEELIDKIRLAVASSLGGDAASVIMAVNTLRVESFDVKHGVGEITLVFDGDLYRKSLYPKKYPGIKNIIALYELGYPHPPDPDKIEAISHIWGYSPKYKKNVYAVGQRAPLGVLSRAIKEFNDDNKKKYGVEAKLDDEYLDPTILQGNQDG